MSELPTINKDDISIIQENEDESGFIQDTIINRTAIRRSNFNLSEKHNFDYSRSLRELFSRKNIIYFGKMIGEEPIPIEQTQGDIIIPIINKKQIHDRIKQMNEKDRSKIAYIHISTIQVILKSTFMGCNTPIELELRDDRIIDKEESIIARGKGNLAEGKIKFDVNIQTGLSLKDKDINKSLTIRYELLRRAFMYKGNHPFTVTYQINYALTNSHHSITFKTNDRIHVDKLFKPLLSLETPNLLVKNNYIERRKSTSEIQSVWIPKIEKPISVINGESTTQEVIQELKEAKEMIRSLSLRI